MTEKEFIEYLKEHLERNNGFAKRQALDALDLINRQQAEIERLQNKLNTVKQELIETIPLIEDDIKTAKSEAVKEFCGEVVC